MQPEVPAEELKPWERLPDEPIEVYLQRLHHQTDGYNSFADMVQNQPEALHMLQRFLPDLLSKFDELQSQRTN